MGQLTFTSELSFKHLLPPITELFSGLGYRSSRYNRHIDVYWFRFTDHRISGFREGMSGCSAGLGVYTCSGSSFTSPARRCTNLPPSHQIRHQRDASRHNFLSCVMSSQKVMVNTIVHTAFPAGDIVHSWNQFFMFSKTLLKFKSCCKHRASWFLLLLVSGKPHRALLK